MDTLPNGTIHVTNPDQGTWDSATAWRVVESVRIGTDEAEGPASFARIGWVEVDRAGRIYVLETDVQEVRVFDSTGGYLRTLGRKGGGPGEFQQAIGLAWDRAGHLWVVDQQNARYSVFDTAGILVASRPRAPTTHFVGSWLGTITEGGEVIEWLGQGLDTPATLVRLDSTDLIPADTFPLPEFESPMFELRRRSGRNLSISRVNAPYAAQLAWHLDPAGHLWFGVTDSYRLYQRRLAGDTVRIVERAFTPIPVTSAERDSALTRLRWFTEQGGQIDPSKIPAAKPAFSSTFSDDQGNLWVIPVVTGERGRTADVFDPEGRYLGSVGLSFSLGFQRPVLRGDAVYAVTLDSMDVPYVVRARIEKGGSRD
jgi:hypothetical protein